MNNYFRNEGESDDEVIFRVCQDKDVIGTWEDVRDILNEILGVTYNESTYRKRYMTFEKMFQANQNKIIDSDYSDAIDKKREELQRERYKLQTIQTHKNRYDRVDARFELFYENVANAIKEIEPPKFNKLFISDNAKEYVVGMGDLHFGANFKSETNEYSRDICRERLEKLLNNLEWFVKDNKVNSLKIINVSDTIQGILRLTDLQINDIPVVDCVVEISRLLAEFINQLSAYCNVEYYHVPEANHSQTRVLGSRANEIATEDMEHIIVNYIADLLRNNDRVQVISDLDKDYVNFDVFNFHCFALHGNKIKNHDSVIKDMSNRNGRDYSYAFLGHTHSANEIIVGEGKTYNKEVFVVPSFIGSDPYADELMVGSKAMVKIYEFDETHGHIGSRNIILN
jgi:hypothetical protein